MKLQRLFLILAIVGFTAPTILVLIESVESGNVLLFANPLATAEAMFANRISTIFMIDLLFTVMVFFVWTYYDGKKNGVKRIGWVWLLTLLLGLAGGFPLYLYLREKTTAGKL
jgi:hypothetical protein